MSISTDVFRTGIDLDTTERAQRAVRAFRSMQPTLTAYARILTKNPTIQVVMASKDNGSTDGQKIWYRPPIALGDSTDHERRFCDKRDYNKQLICAACAIRETVLTTIYHEIAHNCFDSFEETSEEDKSTLVANAIREAGGKYATQIAAKIAEAPDWAKRSYISMSSLISPFLPIIVNALEDARVNRELFAARRGTKVMFAARVWKIFNEGVEQKDQHGQTVVKMWNTYPLNQQVTVGLFLKASSYDHAGWFVPEVEEALADLELSRLVGQMATVRSAGAVYHLSFPILARLRELGYCKSDNDPEEEEPEESQEEDDTDEESGDKPGEESGPEGTPCPDGSPSESGDAGTDPDGREGESTDGGGEDGGKGEPDSDADATGAGEDPTEEDSDGGDSDDDDLSDGSSTEAGSDEVGEEDGPGGRGEPDQEGASEETTAGDGDEGDEEASSEGTSGGRSSDESGGVQSEDAGDDLSEGAEGSSSGDTGPDVSEGADESNGSGSDGSDDSGDRDERGDRDDSSGDDLEEGDRTARRGESDDDDLPDAEGVGGSGLDLAEGDDQEAGSRDRGDDLETVPASQERDGSPTDQAEPGEDSDDLIDTGADQGEGGIDLIENEENDRLPMGTADDCKTGLLIIGDHEEKPKSVEEGTGESAVDRAIIQGVYFETPSQNIYGVREHHYGKPHMIGSYNMSKGWDTVGSYWASPLSTGRDGDFSTPEKILGPALLRMRVAFADNQRGKESRGRRSGRIDARVLGKRAPAGDDRLFKKKTLPGKKDYYVCIMMDVSGSTIGTNLALEKQAVAAQAALLTRMGIPFEIFGYSGNYHDPTFGRGEGIDLDIYFIKEVNEPWEKSTKTRLDTIGPDSANLDGHTLEYARKRLDRATATNKILLYFSDGKMPAENGREELVILQREIKTCAKKGYTLIGVGIRTDSPRAHGLDTVQVDSEVDVIKVVKHLEKSLL